MNKLLHLTNIELKRSSKFYIVYLGIVSILILGLNIIQINKFIKRADIIEKIQDNYDGVFYGVSILNNNAILNTILLYSMVGLIIYSVYMWIREYNQKSIYTLKTLPIDKFNIYLSKMIATVTMIYILLLVQIFMIFISKQIFNIMASNMGIVKTSLFNDLSFIDSINEIIPTTFMSFIMIYGFKMIYRLSILFTFIVFIISFKDKITKYLIAFILIFLLFLRFVIKAIILMSYTSLADSYTYSNILPKYIGNIGFSILGYSITILLLSYISYKLINKKLYI